MTTSISRRGFLRTSAVLATAAGATRVGGATGESSGPHQEYYELRQYKVETPQKQTSAGAYLEHALLPALARMDIHRVGAFTAMDTPLDLSLYVLIPYPSLELFAAVNPALLSDPLYQNAAQAYFSVPKDDPQFSRIHSKIYKAFSDMPVMEPPAQTADRKPRIFELRIYQSHTEEKAALKVDMFNRGEIQVMRDTGLAPVFFGEGLVGNDLPQLAYMLSASDRDAHKAHWSAFGKHPEWKRMKGLPEYQDTVSTITSTFLMPTTYSQL